MSRDFDSGMLEVMAERTGLEDMPTQQLQSELQEVSNWLDIARHRGRFVKEMQEKLGIVREAILDELEGRTDK